MNVTTQHVDAAEDLYSTADTRCRDSPGFGSNQTVFHGDSDFSHFD